MQSKLSIALLLSLVLAISTSQSSLAQDDASDKLLTLDRKALAARADAQAKEADPTQKRTRAEMAELYAKFTKLLTGAKLKGQFTVDGRPMNKLTEETYEIEKVEKQPKGDEWIVTARIKYGKYDTVFPVPLEVKWAGKTPVMTLDKMTIPGMGTFGARVVFHKDKYAGTWSHDEVGGHLFGRVIFADDEQSEGNSEGDKPAENSKN